MVVIGHGALCHTVLGCGRPLRGLRQIFALLLAQQVLSGLFLQIMQFIDQIGGLAQLKLLALVHSSNDLTSNLNFIAYSSLVYWLHDINLGKL